MSSDEMPLAPAEAGDALAGEVVPRRSRRPIVLAIIAPATIAAAAVGVTVWRSGGRTVAPAATAGAAGAAPVTTAVAPPTPPTVSTLSARAGSFRVALTWQPVQGSKPLSGFSLYRDNSWLASGDPARGAYVDETAQPHTKYAYTLVLYDATNTPSPRETTRVRTPSAPLRLARADGVYDVRLKRTSVVGANGIDAKDTDGWRLTPRCSRGPCKTRLKAIHSGGIQTMLTLHKGTYAGSGQLKGYLSCGHTDSTTTVKLDLHPAKARIVSGVWTASVLEGTETLDAAPQLGCRSAHIVYAVTARLLS